MLGKCITIDAHYLRLYDGNMERARKEIMGFCTMFFKPNYKYIGRAVTITKLTLSEPAKESTK